MLQSYRELDQSAGSAQLRMLSAHNVEKLTSLHKLTGSPAYLPATTPFSNHGFLIGPL
jgi:hypothetical protein